MKPKVFHQSMTDVIDSIEKFPKLFWAMFRNPDTTLAKYLNTSSPHRLLPGAFLFINLLLSEILDALWSSTQGDNNPWTSVALRETCHHIAGTLLLLLLLKFAFWQVKPLKLFSILCLSSVVFIPYTLVTNTISFLLAPILLHFFVSVMSHRYDNFSALITPTPSTVFKMVLSLALISTFFSWWFHLLSIGCSHVTKRTTRQRMVRIISAFSAYLVIFWSVPVAILSHGLWSAFSQYADYERMKNSLTSANYAEAFLISASVSKADSLPPAARYRAYLIMAVSNFKTFSPDDQSFDEAVEDIKNRKYREAESYIRTKIQEKVNSQADSNRTTLTMMQLYLHQAEKERNSLLYSEAETQDVGFSFKFGDIPIAFFP